MATGGWNGAVVEGTLDAPGGVGPGEADAPVHIVALVPACGEIVTGGPGLEAESPAGLGVADPLVAGVGAALPVGADVWEGAAVGVDVTGAGDCGVLSWLGDVLGASSG